MKIQTKQRWPNGSLFETMEITDTFTMKGCNEIWMRIPDTYKDNAICLDDGRFFEFKYDSVVYPQGTTLISNK